MQKAPSTAAGVAVVTTSKTNGEGMQGLFENQTVSRWHMDLRKDFTLQ